MALRRSLIIAAVAVTAVQPAFTRGQDPKAIATQDDCARCTDGKTAPTHHSNVHAGVQWYSDADEFSSGDPYSAPHCFVRKLFNSNAGPADVRWPIVDWVDNRFPPKMEQRRCSVSGGVANPPAKGPIYVNSAGAAPTEVWKSVGQMTANEFFPFTTTLHTALYGIGDVPQDAIVTFASYVRAPRTSGELYEYTYFIAVRGGGPKSQPVSADYQVAFGELLRDVQNQFEKAGLLKIGALGTPGRASVTSTQPPVRGESDIRLSGAPAKHNVSIGVELWRPRPAA